MTDLAQAAARTPTPRARRRLRRLLEGGSRRAQEDLTRLNRALTQAWTTDAAADRAAALERLAEVRAAHAALRRRISAVPDAGASGHDAVAAFDLFDRALSAFADLLSRGPTPEGLASADRVRALTARATAELVRVYEGLR
jgi:hypothetical protein